MDIFWEKQDGGLCRKHSLNAYYGHKELSTDVFRNYCKEFDKFVMNKYNYKIDTGDHDITTQEQLNIIGYILWKHSNVYTLFIPTRKLGDYLNNCGLKSLHELVGDDNFYFVYTPGHVWGHKKHDGKWYKVDSLSGVSRLSDGFDYKGNIPLGFIIPRSMKMLRKDITTNQQIILRCFEEHKMKPTEENARKIIHKYWTNADYLGEFEVPIAVLGFHFYGLLGCPCYEECSVIRDLISFFEKLSKSKLDFVFVMNKLPGLVIQLLDMNPYDIISPRPCAS
jgi:hypothetical protein